MSSRSSHILLLSHPSPPHLQVSVLPSEQGDSPVYREAEEVGRHAQSCLDSQLLVCRPVLPPDIPVVLRQLSWPPVSSVMVGGTSPTSLLPASYLPPREPTETTWLYDWVEWSSSLRNFRYNCRKIIKCLHILSVLMVTLTWHINCAEQPPNDLHTMASGES